MKKTIQITKEQFQQIIKEGVEKLHKKTLIENRIKQINEELAEMVSEFDDEKTILLKEEEGDGGEWVRQHLKPHDIITLKAGTLLTINHHQGFIEMKEDTEAIYFGVNKHNQVEVAVKNDLGSKIGTVEFGDIKELPVETNSSEDLYE